MLKQQKYLRKDIIEGVSPEFVQQSLAEAFWLVAVAGGDVNKMAEFVKSKLKDKAAYAYVNKLMPKKNQSGAYTVPPVPREDKLDLWRLRDAAEESA